MGLFRLAAMLTEPLGLTAYFQLLSFNFSGDIFTVRWVDMTFLAVKSLFGC